MPFYNSEQGGTSKFNTGFHKVDRLHDIQSMLNDVKLNPQAFNYEYMEYNYKLWLRCLNNKYFEIRAKLSEDEKKTLLLIKDKVEALLRNYPVQQYRTVNSKKVLEWKDERWVIFKRAFETYEDYLVVLSDAHNFDMPELDDEEGE